MQKLELPIKEEECGPKYPLWACAEDEQIVLMFSSSVGLVLSCDSGLSYDVGDLINGIDFGFDKLTGKMSVSFDTDEGSIYPTIKECCDGGVLVLFVDESIGYVIESRNPDSPRVGHFSYTWVESEFEEFEGELNLDI